MERLEADSDNYVESLTRELRKPTLTECKDHPVFLVPEGWEAEIHEELLPQPLRKKGTVTLTDNDSFIYFLKREGSLANCIVYAEVDYSQGKAGFTAVLNENGEAENQAAWRDHRAVYSPVKSREWQQWLGYNGKRLPQKDFAEFLEENGKDIASIPGMPTGAEMLEMAANFEAKQDIVIKSAVRMQSGTVAFSYTDLHDDATTQRMEVFRQFAIGIAPFFNGQAYPITARLKYHISGGKLTFWYELVRPDLVLQDAVLMLINAVKEAGFPVLFGKP
jgi:uncharacterized protein YfdQ (DUF2303 family)